MNGLKSETNEQATQTAFSIESSSYRAFGSTCSTRHGQQIDVVMVVDKLNDGEIVCIRRNDINQYRLSDLYCIVYDVIHRGYNYAPHFNYVMQNLLR